jgi:hypothetical protein
MGRVIGRNRYDLEAEDEGRREVVSAARSVLNGEIGIIEGARILTALSFRVVADWASDAEFRVLGVLNSETDHLPVGRVRELWDPAALAEKDAIIQRIEAVHRSEVEEACRRLIGRYSDV